MEHILVAPHVKRKGSKSAARVRVISAHEDALLRAVGQYHFLTVEQATRLLYAPGSFRYVRGVLRSLADRGFLGRLRLPRVTPGNTCWVYWLDRVGRRYLESAGDAEPGRFRPGEHQEHAFLFLTHTLACNDFLIAGALLAERVAGVSLAGMRHERTLRHTPMQVTLRESEKDVRVGVVADGFLDFWVGTQKRMPILLELDRGTVEEKPFQRKVRALAAATAIGGPYDELFGADSVTVAIATTAGPKRLAHLMRWCERALGTKSAHTEIFLLTSLAPGELDPHAVFLSPIWYQPFTQKPLALLEGEEIRSRSPYSGDAPAHPKMD